MFSGGMERDHWHEMAFHSAFTCSRLTIKTLEQRRSGVFIVNFEYISHLALVVLLLTLNM